MAKDSSKPFNSWSTLGAWVLSARRRALMGLDENAMLVAFRAPGCLAVCYSELLRALPMILCDRCVRRKRGK